MTNHDVASLITGVGTPEAVTALIETRIETVNASSGIISVNYIPVGDGSKVVGIVIHPKT
jgi:hypothetical protein